MYKIDKGSHRYIPESKKVLGRLADESKKILEEKYKYSQKELEELIKSSSKLSSDLLKYHPDKSTIEYFYNTLKKVEERRRIERT